MLSDQPPEKQLRFFKDALQFQESAAGVAIQKVPAAYLLRILKPVLDARDAAPNERAASRVKAMDHCPDRGDPLIHAIYSLDETFRGAVSKGVDPLSSAEGIAAEHTIDGTKGNGCLFLAWKTEYNPSTKKIDAPKLVGAMTMYKFKRTENFSTHAEATGNDDALLDPFFRSRFLYIDAMVSLGAGVGTLLVMHAYRYAIMKKATGLVALSYSKKRLTGGDKPDSYKIFHALGFQHLVERTNYTADYLRNVPIYGTWFATALDDLSVVNGVLKSGVKLCTRKGFTEKTADRLVWRCPR